jgi:hypothetical protein
MAFNSGTRRPLTYQFEIKNGVESLVLAATTQLDDRSSTILLVDGGVADRDLKMPASNRDGMVFRITNTGATNALNLQDSTGAAIAGATAALAVGEATWVVCEGGTWRHTGIETVVL